MPAPIASPMPMDFEFGLFSDVDMSFPMADVDASAGAARKKSSHDSDDSNIISLGTTVDVHPSAPHLQPRGAAEHASKPLPTISC